MVEIAEEYPDVEIDWESVQSRIERDYWCIETEAGDDPPPMLVHLLNGVSALIDRIRKYRQKYAKLKSEGKKRKMLSRKLQLDTTAATQLIRWMNYELHTKKWQMKHGRTDG